MDGQRHIYSAKPYDINPKVIGITDEPLISHNVLVEMPKEYSIIIDYYPQLKCGKEIKKKHEKISKLAKKIDSDCETLFKNKLGRKRNKKTCRSVIIFNLNDDNLNKIFDFGDRLRKENGLNKISYESNTSN